MSSLIYITATSLDGYVEDETGAFDWVNPDRVHAFITELSRPIVGIDELLPAASKNALLRGGGKRKVGDARSL